MLYEATPLISQAYTASSDSYLDLHLELDSECRLRTKLYDERDDCNFLVSLEAEIRGRHDYSSDS